MSEDATPPAGAAEVEVRILQMPLDVYIRVAEHHDDLVREFALIKEAEARRGQTLPQELVDVVEEVTLRFSSFAEEPAAIRAAAIDKGEQRVDLIYRVPPEAKAAVILLDRLLDEADRYCREGEHLLTLAAPHEALAFRRWFLNEFRRQIEGEPPLPWPGADQPSG